jgi:hypothetical protein
VYVQSPGTAESTPPKVVVESKDSQCSVLHKLQMQIILKHRLYEGVPILAICHVPYVVIQKMFMKNMKKIQLPGIPAIHCKICGCKGVDPQ